MSLPIRTTRDDIIEICRYFSTKPTGSTVKEAKAVIDPKRLDGRKLSALKSWKLIEELDNEKIRVTEKGRQLAKNEHEQNIVLQDVIRSCRPYYSIIERAIHRHEDSFTSTEVAAHWHEHFRNEVSDKEKTINDQAVCFFQLVTGAGLGNLIIGRMGHPTRMSFNVTAISNFVERKNNGIETKLIVEDKQVDKAIDEIPDDAEQKEERTHEVTDQQRKTGRGIFVAHGKNKKPLEQLKKILEQFRIPYKVALEEPNLGHPISSKVRQVMESCNCAILIFTAGEEFKDKNGNQIWRPSENVVYELGASGYLYDNRLVIMKQEEVTFPSNFSDIGYISFEKDKLDAKAMDILKELIGFDIIRVTT
ncbi:MAG TPA: nucleotide-binding protein [Syntrophales bacterium]|nr:nucleotide-binding protein [Syntrophales bacterium]